MGKRIKEIEREALQGKNTNSEFSEGKMVSGTKTSRARRVNVDFSESMLRELDVVAEKLNISRQAVIKTLIDDGLRKRKAG